MKILMRLQDRDLKLHIERVIRLLVGTRMWHLCAKLLASSLSNANSAFEKKKNFIFVTPRYACPRRFYNELLVVNVTLAVWKGTSSSSEYCAVRGNKNGACHLMKEFTRCAPSSNAKFCASGCYFNGWHSSCHVFPHLSSSAGKWREKLRLILSGIVTNNGLTFSSFARVYGMRWRAFAGSRNFMCFCYTADTLPLSSQDEMIVEACSGLS